MTLIEDIFIILLQIDFLIDHVDLLLGVYSKDLAIFDCCMNDFFKNKISCDHNSKISIVS